MKCILIACTIIIVFLFGYTLYNSFKTEPYKTLGNINRHPLELVLGKASIKRRSKKDDKEPHSLKYRGHRYNRRHQRGPVGTPTIQ